MLREVQQYSKLSILGTERLNVVLEVIPNLIPIKSLLIKPKTQVFELPLSSTSNTIIRYQSTKILQIVNIFLNFAL